MKHLITPLCAVFLTAALLTAPFITDAQTPLPINKKGELNEESHKALIRKNGYQALSAFDTVSKSPLLIYALYIKNNKFGILDNYGKEVTAPLYDAIDGLNSSISANLFGFSASYIVKNDKKYGLISNTGKVLLPLEYKQLYYKEKDSVFLAIKDKMEAYIDKTGKRINYVDPDDRPRNTNYLPDYSNTLNTQKTQYTIKNNRKKTVLHAPNLGVITQTFQDRITFKSAEGKFGVYDGAKKKLIIPLQYDGIQISYPGHFIVNSGSKYGVIDSTGAIKLPVNYEAISRFKGGTLVYQQRKFALYSSSCKAMSGFIYDSYTYLGDVACLQKGGKYGMLAMPSGKVILDFVYDEMRIPNAEDLKYPIVILSRGGKTGIADLKGKLLTPFVYNFLLPECRTAEDANTLGEAMLFSANQPNLYYFFQKDGKYGLLDNDYKVIVNNEYDMMIKASRDYVAVKKDKNWGLLNVSTRKMTTGFEYMGKPERQGRNYFLIYKKDGYGLINGNGKTIIPSTYSSRLLVSTLYNGLLDVSAGSENTIYADYHGNNVIFK